MERPVESWKRSAQWSGARIQAGSQAFLPRRQSAGFQWEAERTARAGPGGAETPQSDAATQQNIPWLMEGLF